MDWTPFYNISEFLDNSNFIKIVILNVRLSYFIYVILCTYIFCPCIFSMRSIVINSFICCKSRCFRKLILLSSDWSSGTLFIPFFIIPAVETYLSDFSMTTRLFFWTYKLYITREHCFVGLRFESYLNCLTLYMFQDWIRVLQRNYPGLYLERKNFWWRFRYAGFFPSVFVSSFVAVVNSILTFLNQNLPCQPLWRDV